MARVKTSQILRQFPRHGGEHTDVIASASTLPEEQIYPDRIGVLEASTLRAGYRILKIARKGPA